MATAAGCSRQPGIDNPAEEGVRQLVFRAHAPSAGETKVSVARSGKVSWSEGDEIAVYNASGQKFKATLTDGAGTSAGTFTCSGFSGEAGAVAVYPFDLAGDAPGSISIPWRTERTDAIPAIMASFFSMDASGKPQDLHFVHLAPVVDITLHDIPAYARALVLQAEGKRISGDFSFDTATLGALKTEDLASSLMVSFPYCAGYGTDLSFRIPLPAGSYSSLSISLLDGDEVPIEGLEEIKFGSGSLNPGASDYLAMPVLDVRSLCTRRADIRKVENITWAAGNLIAQSGGSTSEGFQQGWRIAGHQYEFLGWDAQGASGSSTYTQTATAFDRFNWGGLAGDAWLPGAGYMLPTTAKYNISGRIFNSSAGDGAALDASEVGGDARFAVPSGGSLATGSSIHGDVAFWASKGKYRMPNPAEIQSLRAGASATNAHGQAGYVTADGNRIYGILLRSTPSWEESVLNTEAIPLTEADLESGLFLPKAGRGRYTDGKATISYVNTQGYYRTATFSGLDLEKYPETDHCTTVLGFRAANSCDYGYTIHLNSDPSYGVGHVQKCLPIRPVLCTTGDDSYPDPVPQPEAGTLPAWSPGFLDIHAINSGRGECTLVIMPDGTSMMIDAGEYESTADKAVARKPSPSVRPYKVYTTYARYFLNATGHDWLDYFFLTHYHQDHMGQHNVAFGTSGNGYCRSGVMAVYDDIPFKKLVDRCGPSVTPATSDYSTAVYEDFRQFALYRQASDGMEWYPINLNATGNYKKQFVLKYDTSYDFTVYNLGANGKYWDGSAFGTYSGSLTENGECATVLISYGQFDYYHGGDCACQAAIMPKIVSGINKKVEAMKAGHHMYYNTLNSSTAAILQPKVTVGQIFDSDKPGDPAFSLHDKYGDVFLTNIHPGRIDNTADIKGGTPVENLASKVKDYGGHFVIRVSPGGRQFYVYKLRDTDFSYAVEATYGPYSCH
ncbi:MAG: hypothetical protein J5640_07930 [Bacteroidales bacterium]|nr:hypothetical protein [Bacteroidales bacterium]